MRGVVLAAVLVAAMALAAVVSVCTACSLMSYIDARRELERKKEFDRMIDVANHVAEKIPDFHLRHRAEESASENEHEIDTRFPFGRVRVVGH